MNKTRSLGVLAMVGALAAPLAASAALIENGSLENPLSTWTDSGFRYMRVGVGSTAITGWSVGPTATGAVAWGFSPTGDGKLASDGNYFVDLSGFGTEAGPASLDQMLQNLIAGETYVVGVDYQGGAPSLRIDGVAISGALADSAAWTHVTASFVATGAQALLSLRNVTPTNPVVFVDNVTVSGREAGGGALPEPGALALVAAALGALGAGRIGRRR